MFLKYLTYAVRVTSLSYRLLFTSVMIVQLVAQQQRKRKAKQLMLDYKPDDSTNSQERGA